MLTLIIREFSKWYRGNPRKASLYFKKIYEIKRNPSKVSLILRKFINGKGNPCQCLYLEMNPCWHVYIEKYVLFVELSFDISNYNIYI